MSQLYAQQSIISNTQMVKSLGKYRQKQLKNSTKTLIWETANIFYKTSITLLKSLEETTSRADSLCEFFKAPFSLSKVKTFKTSV